MAVASPYAVFRACDLSWAGPPAQPTVTATATAMQQLLRGTQQKPRRLKRSAATVLPSAAMIQGELFQLA